MRKKSYEIKFGKLIPFFAILIVLIICCTPDDNNDIITVEIRDRAEQQMADNDSIVKYLKAHYYNSEELAGISNPKVSDIVITTLLEGENVPDGNTLLFDAVGDPVKIEFAETDYEIYVLTINEGGDKSPTFADNVFVSYEGFTLENEVFDSAVSPVNFDLLALIPGWRKVLPSFKTAVDFVENGDGTVDYNDYGLGVMFIPSGLAYFSNPVSGISAYSPIIFKFGLLNTSTNDHDNDGVPSYLEDLNDDGEFIVNFEDLTDDTDDDTDGDGDPDYVDNDDDGDGILTIDEDTNGDGDPTNDIGINGIAKYLDPTE